MWLEIVILEPAGTTDSIHKGATLRALVLLPMLYLRPGAWAAGVDGLNAGLSAEFTTRDMWLNARGNRVVWRLYWLCLTQRSLAALVFIVLYLLAAGATIPNLVFGTAVGVCVALVGGMLGDLLVSVAAGTIGGALAGVIGGIGYGLIGHSGFDGIFAGSPDELAVLCAGTFVGIGMTNHYSFRLARQTRTSDQALIKAGIGVSITGAMVALTLMGGVMSLCFWLAGKTLQGFQFGIYLQAALSIGIGCVLAISSSRKLVTFMIGSVFFLVFTVGCAVLGTLLDESVRSDSVLFNMVYGLVVGTGDGILICGFYSATHAFARLLAGPRAALLAGYAGLLGGIGCYVMVVREQSPLQTLCLIGPWAIVGLCFHYLRYLVFYPVYAISNLVLLRFGQDQQTSSLLSWNSAFYDEFAWFGAVGLRDHIIHDLEHEPAEVTAQLVQLRGTIHEETIRRALLEGQLRAFEGCRSVADIAKFASMELPGAQISDPQLAPFRSLTRDIALSLSQGSAFARRMHLQRNSERLLFYTADTQSAVAQSARHEHLAFYWRSLVDAHAIALEQERSERNEIVNPYIVAVPLGASHQIFVGRHDIARQIEALVWSDVHSPLLLHGPRRIGKTSLLQNLTNMLPSGILPIFVDLQGPASSASDHGVFLRFVAESIVASADRSRGHPLPQPAFETESHPLIGFTSWLDQLELALDQVDMVALLTLDEFEALHENFISGDMLDGEVILGLLRNVVQHRRRIKLLFASSYRAHAFSRWARYLVNLRPVPIGRLNDDEAIALITRPVPDFQLTYTRDAVDGILRWSSAHPAVIQMLCSTLIDRQNEQARVASCITAKDIENLIDDRLFAENLFFFEDIERTQADEVGRAVLSYLGSLSLTKQCSEAELRGAVNTDVSKSLRVLVDREILRLAGGLYQFQIALVHCWFARKL